MTYMNRNGRLYKQHFVTGIVNGRGVSREGWIDCGPAPQLSRFDRALLAMEYFEARGRGRCDWCDIARKAALAAWGNTR